MSDQGLVFTLAQLHKYTEVVIELITTNGKPAGITHGGRFIATITPIDDAEVITAVLREGPIADELAARSREQS